ncbi:MAG: methionyl-tRNA formyltransferase [Deltaproteobacteria bacterium]|nr:methionyl-tRNA formyltransferase [Deltaproteobacteria bacterium]
MEKNVLFCGFGKLGLDCAQTLHKNGYCLRYILSHKDESETSLKYFADNISSGFSAFNIKSKVQKTLSLIDEYQIDYLISINYRYIIPEEIISSVKFKVNIHGSLLPRYRGRTPHVWSIINGEKQTGITAHVMTKGVDTGDIIYQKVIPIGNDDTGASLLEKYEKLYPDILLTALHNLEISAPLKKQNEEEATYFGKRIPEMGYINFRANSTEIINFVRAQAYPYPGAYYYLPDGKKIIIDKIQILENHQTLHSFTPEYGIIVYSDDRYLVRCFDSILEVKDFRI